MRYTPLMWAFSGLILATLACTQTNATVNRADADPIEVDSVDEAFLHFEAAADYSAELSGAGVVFMVEGDILFEDYANGHSPDDALHLYSGTKSFWCPAIAAMIEDGYLTSYDDIAADTLTEWQGVSRKEDITVRHLLNLSSGLAQDITDLQDVWGDPAADKYDHALTVRQVAAPNQRFSYGPSNYFALGALMDRLLEDQDPLEYLDTRLFQPLGISYSEWISDAVGNPHLPNGAYLTARDWLRFGEFMLAGGKAPDGTQLVDAVLLAECIVPSEANPGYGMTFWLNQPGGVDWLRSRSGEDGFVYSGGYPDLYMAAGAGGNRLYVIPSLNMIIVRQSDVALRDDDFEDEAFFAALFGR
ncbi:MAG: serine hydrolase [Chloroflexi bacterium]|nr:serine hydrolase [Chloroflexota bacterium]